MSDASQRLGELGATATVITAVVLMVAGLATKMALFPLHVWLPDAHSHAPPAAAALLASVQVKVAAYALIRIVFEVVPDNVLTAFPLLAIITWAGVGGVLFGSVMAIRQTEFKRMLAFSTVAQLGYIGIGIGLDTPLALIGALLLVLNHAFMKGTMFFVAGSVYEATGRKAISAFAGLGRRMPWTMTGFTIAAASMIGLPPTAGFFSKFYLVLGAADAGGTGTPWTWVVAVVVAVSSILTLTYFIPVLEAIWFKPDPDGDDAPACEARALAVLPVAVLAVGLLGIGFVNVSIVNDLLDPIAVSLLGPRG
jgi:multicomponent Na+:H+ antiporter subunit D